MKSDGKVIKLKYSTQFTFCSTLFWAICRKNQTFHWNKKTCVWQTVGSSVWSKQCYLVPSNENELRQMHRTKWFSFPYWTFMELSSKDLRIQKWRWERRETKTSLQNGIESKYFTFFLFTTFEFWNFLQVWKILELPISIHNLWSWVFDFE